MFTDKEALVICILFYSFQRICVNDKGDLFKWLLKGLGFHFCMGKVSWSTHHQCSQPLSQILFNNLQTILIGHDGWARKKIRIIQQKAKQNVVIKKFLPVKGLCGRCICVRPMTPYPLSPLLTVYVYIVYLFIQGKGESWTREKGQQALQSWVENANITDGISSL